MGAARADEVPKGVAEFQDLLKRAGEAKAAGRLDEALRLHRESLRIELPQNVREVYGIIHFNIACVEAQRGRHAETFKALNDAVGEGFLDWTAIDSVPELSKLKKKPQMRAVIAKMKELDRGKRPFVISEWENPDLRWAEVHRFDPIDAASSKYLRDTWKLDKVIAGRKTELEQQLALMAWVHNRWQHGGLDQPSKPEARTILTEAAEGRRFRCVEYSITLTEVLQAMGFPARTISLRMDGASYGVGKGHVVTEVWSNELGKWFVLDGQNNATWRHGEELLNAAEIRELLLSGKGGEVRFGLHPSSWRTWEGAFDEPGQRAEWVRYFHGLTYKFENTRLDGSDDARARVALVHEEEQFEPVFQGAPSGVALQTREVVKIYPELNRVHFDLSAEGEFGAVSNVLTLRLSHSSPWFARYRVTVDGQPDEQREHVFRWKLKPGENLLELRAIDQQGRAGPPSRLTVTWQPQKKEP